MAKKKKSGMGILIELMQGTRCQRCGTRENTVTYDRKTRTGTIRRTTRCVFCK